MQKSLIIKYQIDYFYAIELSNYYKNFCLYCCTIRLSATIKLLGYPKVGFFQKFLLKSLCYYKLLNHWGFGLLQSLRI